MKCKELFSEFEKKVPVSWQEPYDNCGLQIGNPENEIDGILYTLDFTSRSIDQAVANKCNLVICHHPFIFGGLKNINLAKSDGLLIEKCIREKICVYAAHTNFDKFPHGVSEALALQLGLLNTAVLVHDEGNLKKLVTFCPEAQAESVRNALFDAGAGHIGNYDSCSFNVSGSGSFRAGENASPFVGKIGEIHIEPEVRIETVFPSWRQSAVLSALFAFHPYEEIAFDIYPLENSWNGIGLGSIGQLPQVMDAQSFVSYVKSALNLKSVRHSHFLKNNVSRVAVCGGSGASFINQAIQAGAQAFITADVKYHDFQAAAGRILLLDAGHFETEIFALTALKSLVSEFLPNFVPQIISPDSNWVNTV